MDKDGVSQGAGRNVRLGQRKVRGILHQGACSNSLEDDGRYMMDNNFTYSKELLAFATAWRMCRLCMPRRRRFTGPRSDFTPEPANERPLNLYGFSKLAFDNYVRRQFAIAPPESTVVGLRYFNAYGPREGHKGRMASVMQHFARQLRETGTLRDVCRVGRLCAMASSAATSCLCATFAA